LKIKEGRRWWLGEGGEGKDGDGGERKENEDEG